VPARRLPMSPTAAPSSLSIPIRTSSLRAAAIWSVSSPMRVSGSPHQHVDQRWHRKYGATAEQAQQHADDRAEYEGDSEAHCGSTFARISRDFV